MNLLADLGSLLSRYAKHAEVYIYSLLGSNGYTLAGGDKLSVGSNALLSLSPVIASLAHDILNGLRTVESAATVDVNAAAAADAASN